jgi:glyoxylase-like metal-dependent hydrolase (beta-lactamase superfamily II)
MAQRFANLHRRAFLQTAALGAAAFALPWRVSAQGAITATAVDADSALLSGAGGNVFATRSADGLILVDTGLAERADDLKAALADHFGDDRIAAAFNTHWHYENTGGNAMARAAGARIYAHENTRLWLDGDFYVAWQDRHYKPLPEEAQPSDTFYTGGEVTIGGRGVEYVHHKRAHTDGDIAIHFPDANITVAGDLVSVGAYPVFDYATGGWIGAFTQASERLLEAAAPDTKIVPGLGPVVGRDHLQAQTDMLTTVRERIYELVRLGRGAEEMLAAEVTKEFDAEWGDPTVFITNTYPGLWAHSYEVGRVV